MRRGVGPGPADHASLRTVNLFAIRKHVDRVLFPLVTQVARLPLRANQWTLLGTLVGITCAGMLLTGRWWAGFALLVLRGLIDNIDGFVARTRGQRSAFGAVIDDVADRWVLGITYAAAAIHLSADYPHILIVLGVGLTGSLCNVIAKQSIHVESTHDVARIDGKVSHPVDLVGVFGSAEYLIYFGAGILLGAIMDDPRPCLVGIWAVAVMSHVSLLQRLVFAWRRYRSVDASAARDST
jgi:archaetidylinositol phosphate synthase